MNTTLVARGTRRINVDVDGGDFAPVFVGHTDRCYQKENGTWSLEDSDTASLTCAKHPVVKGVKHSWNTTVDTVRVDPFTKEVILCTDGVSKADRAAYNAVNKAAHSRSKWVKTMMRNRVSQTLPFAVVATPSGTRHYVGLVVTLMDNGHWLAVAYEGIVND